MKDAREELDAGRGGGRVGRREGRNVKLFIVKVLILPIVICQIVKVFVIILFIVICQRRPTPGLLLGDT